MDDCKLVRDKIPSVIKDRLHSKIRPIPPNEMEVYAREKILEEAKEFYENPGLEELADLYDAILLWLRTRGYTIADLVCASLSKRARRGGFRHGFLLCRKH